MKNKYLLFVIILITPVVLLSQTLKRQESYDISKDSVLYVIGYAHLDTQWLWDYPTTIDEYIKNLLTENFHLFEKYLASWQEGEDPLADVKGG